MASPQPQTVPPQLAAAPRLEGMAAHVTAGSLIARSFEVWWRNLGRFSLVALVVYLPIFGVGVATGVPLAQAALGPSPETMAWRGFAIAILVTLFLVFAAIAAYTYGTIQYLSGKPVRVGALLGAGMRRAFPAIAAGALVGLAMMSGFLLLFVPGVIFACALYVAIPAAVVEREGIFASLGRSWRLTRGRRLAIFAAGLVFLAINWAASLATQMVAFAFPEQLAAVAAVLSFLVSVPLSSLPGVMPAVAYHDLRVEKEGVATEDLVKVFE
jgi:hypothetical protein